MNKAKQQGFTLIELIVVIVILGILAVTAAPKFISFTSDANVAALKGIRGGILGGMSITNANAAINGQEAADTAADLDGVNMIFGYPTATAAGVIASATLSASATKADVKDYSFFIKTETGADSILIAPTSKVVWGTKTATDEGLITATECYITYKEADASNIASVVISDEDKC